MANEMWNSTGRLRKFAQSETGPAPRYSQHPAARFARVDGKLAPERSPAYDLRSDSQASPRTNNTDRYDSRDFQETADSSSASPRDRGRATLDRKNNRARHAKLVQTGAAIQRAA